MLWAIRLPSSQTPSQTRVVKPSDKTQGYVEIKLSDLAMFSWGFQVSVHFYGWYSTIVVELNTTSNPT